jgi:diacylglycerol kinase (ATP)
MGVMALVMSLFLNLTRSDIIAVIVVIALVLITEVLNTAVELVVDLITEEHHPVAMIIKDLAAGAVLFSAICAAVVGYLVFMKRDILEVFECCIYCSGNSSFNKRYQAEASCS